MQTTASCSSASGASEDIFCFEGEGGGGGGGGSFVWLERIETRSSKVSASGLLGVNIFAGWGFQTEHTLGTAATSSQLPLQPRQT
jgi:hypothetical protein